MFINIGDLSMEEFKPTSPDQWMTSGKEDPFGNQYDHEDRTKLTGGDMTDGEVQYSLMMNFREVMGIHYVTIAQDRIRWLSRLLFKREKEIHRLKTLLEKNNIDYKE